MKKVKRLVAILCLVVSCLSIGAFAAANSQTVQAVMSFDTTVKYNNQVQKLKDPNGKQVFPLILDGTTYLPVRAVSEMLKVAVDWDGKTKTVYLGTKGVTPVTAKMFESYGADHMPFSSDKTNFVVDGTAYDCGIMILDGWSSTDRDLKLDGKYGTLICLLANTGEKSLQLLFEDQSIKNVVKDVTLQPGESMRVEVPVAGIKTLNIAAHASFGGGQSGVITDINLQ